MKQKTIDIRNLGELLHDHMIDIYGLLRILGWDDRQRYHEPFAEGAERTWVRCSENRFDQSIKETIYDTGKSEPGIITPAHIGRIKREWEGRPQIMWACETRHEQEGQTTQAIAELKIYKRHVDDLLSLLGELCFLESLPSNMRQLAEESEKIAKLNWPLNEDDQRLLRRYVGKLNDYVERIIMMRFTKSAVPDIAFRVEESLISTISNSITVFKTFLVSDLNDVGTEKSIRNTLSEIISQINEFIRQQDPPALVKGVSQTPTQGGGGGGGAAAEEERCAKAAAAEANTAAEVRQSSLDAREGVGEGDGGAAAEVRRSSPAPREGEGEGEDEGVGEGDTHEAAGRTSAGVGEGSGASLFSQPNSDKEEAEKSDLDPTKDNVP